MKLQESPINSGVVKLERMFEKFTPEIPWGKIDPNFDEYFAYLSSWVGEFNHQLLDFYAQG